MRISLTTSFSGAASFILGANDALATGAPVSFAATSTGYLDLNGKNQTVAGLSGGSAADQLNNAGSSDSTLTLAGLTNDYIFVGTITDGPSNKISLVMNNSSGFTQTLGVANTYSGDTTVTSGTLILTAANTGNESSTVTIANTGALILNFGGTDTVDKLVIGTTQMPAGTYGPSATNVPQITGSGTLTVTSGPSGSGFASWKTANYTSGGLGDDHDNDGVSNGIEYFRGGPNGTTGFTALPGVTNTAGTLSVTWTKGSGYAGTYDTDFWVETSATLAEPWTKETLGGGHITNDSGSVKYTFPGPLGAKKFARLKVTGP